MVEATFEQAYPIAVRAAKVRATAAVISGAIPIADREIRAVPRSGRLSSESSPVEFPLWRAPRGNRRCRFRSKKRVPSQSIPGWAHMNSTPTYSGFRPLSVAATGD
jgi:hypothetical protein